MVSPTRTDPRDPEEKRAPRSKIIERLNEQFGTNVTDQDRSFFGQVKERAVRDEKVRETERAKLLDVLRLGVWDQISKLMIERMSENNALVKRYLEEPEFQNVAYEVLARGIFAAVRGGEVART